MAAARTFYEILNVSTDAELVVVEAAYRALMKKYHPDQGGAVAAGPGAAEINLAYAVLRDPKRRAEYDHKEWIRQRDVQLASYQPPPPRRSNFFGWGGWLVSLVLAGMIALMASNGGAPAPSPAEQARAAAMAAPDLRSQPLAAGERVVTAAEMAEIRAAAAPRPPQNEAGKNPAAAPAAAPPAASAPSAGTPAPSRPAAAAPPARRPVYARRFRPPHRRRGAAARRGEKDFLERQGYIY